MLKKWKNVLKCGKYIWILALSACMWISGCSNSGSWITGEENGDRVENKAESVMEESDVEDEAPEILWTKDEMKSEIEFLESNFGDGIRYHDMDEDEVLSYVKSIEHGFEFVGRIAEDGYGYILAFQKYNKNIFDGYDHYWVDQDYVIVDRNEETDEEIEMYRLSNVSTIYADAEYEFMWIQPENMEEPRELAEAFREYRCNGEEGRNYLESVMDRDVRLTPPIGEEGYISVHKFENGERYQEYIVLSLEEERNIISSDAVILPEWYGQYGLQYYVSNEIFEEYEDEEGPITAEVLKIAEERCGYVAEDISEIRNIAAASLTMRIPGTFGEQEQIQVEITDVDELKKLEEIFSSAEVYYEGKCPYWGVLTLIREDGKEIVLSLAIDSCDGFVYGSNGFYTVGKENTKKVWGIFEEARPFTGWDLEE